MTKIGILGSGKVAKALSRAFMGHGYQIVLGRIQEAKSCCFMSRTVFSRHNIIVKNIIEQASVHAII
jgi:predicted dinucleotide-binding enzyme